MLSARCRYYMALTEPVRSPLRLNTMECSGDRSFVGGLHMSVG